MGQISIDSFVVEQPSFDGTHASFGYRLGELFWGGDLWQAWLDLLGY